MSRTHWRLWLTLLILIALPLRGLAGLGAAVCCPPGQHAAMAPVAQASAHAHQAAGHGAAWSAPVAVSVLDASQADAPDDTLVLKAPLCGAGASMAGPSPSLLFVPERAGAVVVSVGSRYLSAELAVRDKPPRS
jgi:hypothetical protein